MKKILLYLQNHQTRIASLVLFSITVCIVVYFTPRELKFKYEFQQGKPWLYENLVAPYDFAILKSQEDIDKEKADIRANRTLFLTKDSEIEKKAQAQFSKDFLSSWESLKRANDTLINKVPKEKLSPINKDSLMAKGIRCLSHVYHKGLLEPFEASKQAYSEVLYTNKGISEAVQLSDYHSISSAGSFVMRYLKDVEEPFKKILSSACLEQLQYNIHFDEKTSANYLKSQLEDVLPTRELVQEGELIIFKGNIVDEEKFAKLNSYKVSYQGSERGRLGNMYLLAGQLLQIGLLFMVLYLFLRQFRRQLMEDITKLTFVLANILFIVILVGIVTRYGLDYVYLIPFTILPITLRSFFDTRLAIFVNMIVVLVCGVMLPNSFEFIYLQFIAGVFSVLMVDNFYKRSQLFFTAAKIILVYCLSYLALAIIQEGSLDKIDTIMFAYFAGNGFLTLMSFPLIYFQEKTFGFVSDISLLELSDTNNKLLRKLAEQAPGTFQHSMQVANLAEAAVLKIEGNALLVRTGALYHDIGKLANPMYFIENQATGFNPHDELSFEESAEIIIGHVLEGIKLAKKHNLPDTLIDFIRTHHGTSTVMYFYKQYIKNFPKEEVDLVKFTYPGPKPFSKETAALMMADSVEAASRSLAKPNHENIDKLVEGIIDHQMSTGQFENADITLREIKEIKKTFKKMLMNIYHVRIQYPE